MRINPFAAMGNGPMAMMIRAAQGGGNPMQILGQLAGKNPQMAQGMQMVQGKDAQQLEQMARNMARERGVSVEQIMNTLGVER